MSDFYGHTKEDEFGNRLPKSEWQPLEAHLQNVANLSKSFAEPYGLGEEAYLAGIAHDMGKYSIGFQDKLNGIQNNFIDHSSQGARLLAENKHNISALAAHAHHIGLNKSMLVSDLQSPISIKEPLEAFGKEFGSVIVEKNKAEIICLENAHNVRFVLSCLVDADRIDTENFCNPISGKERMEYSGSLLSNIDRYIENLNKLMSQFLGETKLNVLRKEFYDNCVEVAKTMDKIQFSLTGITGIGKTLASIAFALYHAKKYNKNRLIVVLPYMSITEQTAKVLGQIFGEANVLEHHSNFHAADDLERKYGFLSQNWDSPIVVTTSAQFFNSLYSNHPSDVRKIHNIANSVVVFDEVQVFPVGLLEPTLDAIKHYSEKFKTSFVFCTATQPAFNKIKGFEKVDVTEIIYNPEKYRNELKRVNFVYNQNPMTFDEVAMELLSHDSAFCILNTKKDAKKTLEAVNSHNLNHKAYYMTTGLCGGHRTKILNSIKSGLNNHEKIILVCTQLIEAGVDIDFPFGMRVIAPLDSIIQSGGRVNREGKMKSLGSLMIFGLEGQFDRIPNTNYCLHFPNESYLRNSEKSVAILKKTLEIDTPEIMLEYYSSCYRTASTGTQITKSLSKFEFEDVKYDFINSPTQSVVVPYGERGKLLIKELEQTSLINKSLFKKIKGLTVNLYPKQFDDANKSSLIRQVGVNGVFYWSGSYDDISGLD